jgi:hypothetical protein
LHWLSRGWHAISRPAELCTIHPHAMHDYSQSPRRMFSGSPW